MVKLCIVEMLAVLLPQCVVDIIAPLQVESLLLVVPGPTDLHGFLATAYILSKILKSRCKLKDPGVSLACS